MATKAKPSTAVAVKASSNIVSVQEMMRQQLVAQAGKTSSAGGNAIKDSSGAFAIPNGMQWQDPLKVVILDFVTQHVLYENDYKQGEISPIICAAVGDNIADLAPYATIKDSQCDTCTGCWANEFKSAKMGEGKACKQVRNMAVLVQDDKGNIDPNGPIYLLPTTPATNKAFDPYVKSVGAVFQMPPIGVVTTLIIVQQGKNSVLSFNDPSMNEDLSACVGRQAEARAMLIEPVNVVPATPKAPVPTRGKPAVAARR